MHSVQLSNTNNNGHKFHGLGLFVQCSYTVKVDSAHEDASWFLYAVLTKLTSSVYTALCKQKAGPACVCVTVLFLTPKPNHGMHRKWFQ